jgi:peptide/nickel transport system substrate-binding protein
MYQPLADGLPQARTMIASGQFAGKPFASNGLYAFHLNPRVPPFNNVLLRRAVQAAFDPTLVSNGLFAGNCPPGQQPVLPSSWAYDPKWKPNPYNPTLAKQLMAQAGVPDGFSFTMTTPNITSIVGFTQALQDQLSKVGIKMAIRTLATTSDPIIAQGQAQGLAAAWLPSVDPSAEYNLFYNLSTLRLASALGTPVEQSLQTSFYHALDPRLTLQQRGAVYKKIWKTVYDQALLVNVCSGGQVWLHTKKLLNADYVPYRLFAAVDPRYVTKTT